MNDRELLELAARAAGFIIFGSTPGRPGVDICGKTSGSKIKWWSPLTDDGDALRLAAKLDLAIEFGQSSISVSATQTQEQSDDDERGDLLAIELWHGSEGSKLKAMRLAIVRAAAKIEAVIP